MTAASSPAAAVRLFYSYAHEDEELRNELQGHLKILERKNLIAPWHDRRIAPGQDWNAAIDENLRDAELVLLLVSADFIASDYIMGKELAAAMAQHGAGQSTVVWIKLRPLDLQPDDTDVAPFLKLQGLPPDLKPVTSWAQRDEAWVLVAQGLRKTVEAIRCRRVTSGPPAAPAVREATASYGRARVFISHAREDRATAQAVAAALAAAGLDVWWDREVRAGNAFSNEIERQIDAARVAIVLWSATAVQSGFVRDEASRAREAGKLLPVRIEDVAMPLGFGTLQTLELIGWDGDAGNAAGVALCAEVQRAVSRAASPQAPPPLASRSTRGMSTRLTWWWRRWLSPKTESSGPVTTTAAPAKPDVDPSFDELLARVRAPLAAATRERGAAAPDEALLDRYATWLIDRPGEPPRILWVDDHPEGNHFERTALARLQIEVKCATGGDEALALARLAIRPFDLVISDWARPADGPEAGLTFLRRMREADVQSPIVYYHAEFDKERRAARRVRAQEAGALGEAVLPQELIEMVVAALRAKS